MELRKDSCICGYHVYNETWTTVLGEVLLMERELHNMTDRYAVTIKTLQRDSRAPAKKNI